MPLNASFLPVGGGPPIISGENSTLSNSREQQHVRHGAQPDPQPDILVVADVHLNGADPEALEAFLAFLRRETVGCGTLILLGDLFDLWLGPPALQEPHHRVLVDTLADLRRRGLVLAYCEGNRDLFVARYFGESLFHMATEGAIVLNQGGRRFVMIHGDRLNRIDYNYRLWNRLVRNDAVRLLLRTLPSSLTLKLAAALERSLRSTNRRFRTYFPQYQCERFARRQFGLGADVVLLGHFHQRLTFRYDADEAPGGEVQVLPDWLSRRAALRIGPGGEVRTVGGTGSVVSGGADGPADGK
jgi:UDP-2,3-diacylglucosamine pyrophosphatase LpxH